MAQRRRGWLATVGRAAMSLLAVLGDDARRRNQLGLGSGSPDAGGRGGKSGGPSRSGGPDTGHKDGSKGQGSGNSSQGAGKGGGQDTPPEIPVSPDLQKNRAAIEQRLGDTSDIVFRSFTSNLGKGFALYINGLADDAKIIGLMTSVVDLSNPPHQQPKVSGDPSIQYARAVSRAVQLKLLQDMVKVTEAVLAGGTAVFFEGSEYAVVGDTRWNPGRSVTEPIIETDLRGPQDAFNENLRINTALVRRRIRDPRLRIELMRIGTRSKTEVELVYIEGLADPAALDEVRRRLKRVNIDSTLSSGQIEELIKDSPRSPFDTMLVTERPDRVAAALLEGHFAILVDNTPSQLIAPTTFWVGLTAPGDYYQNFWAAVFFRFIRLGALLLALSLPSLYVLLTTFHQEMIPSPLALAIAAGREGTPLPTVIEVLMLDLMFEVLHEAGLRLPQAVGQTVSIVGALVIGQAAVQAGLIAPATVIIVAATGLSVFAIPSYSTSITIRLLRFPLMLISGFLGVFGFIIGTALIAFHLASLRSFGTPYLAPVAPVRRDELKDTFIRAPWWDMRQRPLLSGDRRSQRMSPGQRPHPPDQGPEPTEAEQEPAPPDGEGGES